MIRRVRGSAHLKHETGWQVKRLPDGSTQWTAPTGHIYTRPPDELPRDTTMNDPDPPANDGRVDDSTDESDAPPF